VLTPAACAVALWVAIGADDARTGLVPGLVATASLVTDYAVWRRRQKPWHDPTVITLLLPALAAALWIGVGGTLLDVERSEAGLLLLEIGPGLALTGLTTTLISYHGRHKLTLPFETA
jgi:hypothetical protein